MFLPFEKLPVFDEIPAKSRDISLTLLSKRYQLLNYQPETKAISGISKDKIRYISYDFKNPELNLENMLKNNQN